MRKNATVLIAALGAVTVTACASSPKPLAPSPNLAPIAGSPVTIHGRLYAECIGQAATTGKYDVNSDPGAHLLRFICSGAPARAFYTELGRWSAAHHSEWVAEARTWRSTGKVIRNLFGVDYCSTDGVSDYQCVIVLNVGPFLAE